MYLNIVIAAVATSSEILLFTAGALASMKLHRQMLAAVLRWPMSLFDTVPVGRVVARFAKDIDAIDSNLPQILSDWLYCLFEVTRCSRQLVNVMSHHFHMIYLCCCCCCLILGDIDGDHYRLHDTHLLCLHHPSRRPLLLDSSICFIHSSAKLDNNI